jgi:hypothetical protein
MRRRWPVRHLPTQLRRSQKSNISRLANLDHNLQVLLIEGGESNLNNPWVFRPGICESLD